MSKIRVGIIGQGRSGYSIHAAGLEHLPDKYEVVAIADPMPGRCDDAAEKLGATPYKSYKRLLKRDDLDLVVNASPSHLHLPITLEIMEAGHNVVCEKPLARYVSDVDKMIAKSKETGKLFTIFQQSRFAPYFQNINRVIDSGVLGRIVAIRIAFSGYGRRWDWQTLQECSAGNLLNTGPHPLDQALQLLGPDAKPEVTCVMDRACTFGDAEDFVKIMLRAKNRPVVDLEISSCCAYPTHTYNIDGTLGGLKSSITHADWKWYDPKDAPEQHLRREPLEGRKYCSEELPWQEASWDLPEEDKNWFLYMTKSYYTRLYETIVNGAPLFVKPEEVRRQVAVIEECHRQNPLPRMK